MRISDWSSDVCSSDLVEAGDLAGRGAGDAVGHVGQLPRRGAKARGDIVGGLEELAAQRAIGGIGGEQVGGGHQAGEAGSDAVRIVAERSEEHTSELQSLMRISYAVFCLKKKKKNEGKIKQIRS